MKKILILMLPFLLLACMSDNEKELIKDCDGLAMLYYRGLPKPSKLYKSHCQEKESSLEYNPGKCKLAMGDLMLNGSEVRIKKMFGQRIMECFNKVDLDRFIK
ncbi:MAG: hypothetical protein K9K67_06200 [Bacteriovoracaceae bacterium]|nr:hypothetical protein [Bacteriovoracaceae bacterium]